MSGDLEPVERKHGVNCGPDGVGLCVRCTGFQPGHELSLKHGVFSKLRIGARAEELAVELRERLTARLGPATCELDDPMVQLLAVALAQVEAASEHLLEHGLVTAEGQASPLVRHIGTMLNTAARIADRLGMDPPARAALGLDLARTGDELNRYLAERRTSAVEAGDES